jgi:hypothetical protein
MRHVSLWHQTCTVSLVFWQRLQESKTCNSERIRRTEHFFTRTCAWTPCQARTDSVPLKKNSIVVPRIFSAKHRNHDCQQLVPEDDYPTGARKKRRSRHFHSIWTQNFLSGSGRSWSLPQSRPELQARWWCVDNLINRNLGREMHKKNTDTGSRNCDWISKHGHQCWTFHKRLTSTWRKSDQKGLLTDSSLSVWTTWVARNLPFPCLVRILQLIKREYQTFMRTLCLTLVEMVGFCSPDSLFYELPSRITAEGRQLLNKPVWTLMRI